MKGDIKSSSTEKVEGVPFPLGLKLVASHNLTQSPKGLNVCRETEAGDECSINTLHTCCFPPELSSQLGGGSGTLFFMLQKEESAKGISVE